MLVWRAQAFPASVRKPEDERAPGGWPMSPYRQTNKTGCPRSGFSDLGLHDPFLSLMRKINALRRTMEGVWRAGLTNP